MKINKYRNVVIQSSRALALTLVLAFASLNGESTKSPKKGEMMDKGQKTEHHMAMKEHQKKMRADMKVQDAELNSQIAAINKAPEKQKMELMVAAFTTMVEQRAAMYEGMLEMMNAMNGDMSMNHGAMSSHSMIKDKSSKKSSSDQK